MKTSILSRKSIRVVLALVFWVAVWYIAAAFIDKEIFLPYPHTVVERFTQIALKPYFLRTVSASLFRILAGFVIGIVLGFGLSFLTRHIPLAEAIISPAIRVVRATPVVSFILLAYLWLDNDSIPIFIALLMVVPIIWQNISAGLSNLDTPLLEMAKVFKLPFYKVLVKIILPQLKPYFSSASITALGLAWKSGIAAEVISYPRVAIGKAMNEAKVLLETADVLVWTVVVVILSLVFEGVLKLLLRENKRVENNRDTSFKKDGEADD